MALRSKWLSILSFLLLVCVGVAAFVWFSIFAVHTFPASEVRILSAVEAPDGVKVTFNALVTPIWDCPGATIDETDDCRNIRFLRVFFKRRPTVDFPRIIRRFPGEDGIVGDADFETYVIFPSGNDLYYRGEKLEITTAESEPTSTDSGTGNSEGSRLPTSGQ